MRQATMIGVALIAALALSVGAFAYPVVVGLHPSSTALAGSPATVAHPRTGDNSTDNETNENETGDHQVPPAANETENETEAQDNNTAPPGPPSNETENESEVGNVSVEHNVTVAHVGNTTYVNGTIVVMQGNVTVLAVTFNIVATGNGSTNVTINRTDTVNGVLVTIRGFAVFAPDEHMVFVAGTATGTVNGVVQWERPFGFELPVSGASSY